MNQTVPYGNLIIFSSLNGQFSANRIDDLYVKMNEIIYGKYIRAWKNLKGLLSDKWDSAD